MKKFLIGFSVFLFLILTILIIGLSSISSIVTPDFIVKQIEGSINVRADLKKVNISLFSILSSVELEDLSIYERDSFADNGSLLIQRSAPLNPVLQIRKVDLKLNFLGLLKRSFQLKNFVLIEPSVNIVLRENGNNLSHLFQMPKIVEGNPNPSLKETGKEEIATKEEKPFHINSLPISANIGKIGIENGTIGVFLQKTQQKILIKNVNLLLTDIDINPENLLQHNLVQLTANLNLSVLNSGGQETALLKIISKGSISPFIAQTGLLNPSLNYHLTIKAGSYLNSLSIMDSLSGNLPVLANLGIKMDGISKRADLMKDVNFEINYTSGKITLLQSVLFLTANYDLTLEKESWIHIGTNEHKFEGGILASKGESEKAINNVDSLIKKQLKLDNPIEIRNQILGNLTKNDRINLPFVSTGNIKSANVKLSVILPEFSTLVKGVISDKLKDEIKKKLPAGVDDMINTGLKKLF